MSESRPRQASVNEGIDMVVDSAQAFKNFVNGMMNDVLDAGQDAKDEVNELVDSLIDKLQGMKG